ncbi:MAG: carboxypeptidase-like regulatory domain-containing protein, partial [Deltaproteobacteria bacterium]|nr:carboxypeptidase-like regulatory domain-containing protein [Deltaproteobacteria bacterium]
VEAFDLGACSGIFCTNQEILTLVDEDGDGLSNADDDNDDGDDQDDADDLCNASGCGNPVQRDGDGDSIPDFFEGIYGSLTDTDDDGVPNEFDIDIDGDGTVNASDSDDDDDGTDDVDDEDADNDGITSAYELDSDRDGVPNFLDWDIDGDDTINDSDTDDDGDDVLDTLDLDDDDNGIADAFESDTDDDGDGIPDFIDETVEEADTSDTRSITGTVTDSDGNGFPGLTVIAYDSQLAGASEIGLALTDADGNYSILYESDSSLDVFIRVYDDDEEELAESDVQFNSDDDATIDVTI